MKNNISLVKMRIRIGIGCFATSALFIAIIPLLQFLPNTAERICGIVAAVVFWLGLAVGILMNCSINSLMYREQRKMTEKHIFEKQQLPGIISFSVNKKNLILYGICIVGVLLMLSDLVFHYISEFVMFPIVAITYFAFAIHCVADGKNYKLYLNAKDGIYNDVKQ